MTKKLMLGLALLGCGHVLAGDEPKGSAVNLTGLRCEYRTDPRGLDVEKPRLSWVIEAMGQKSGARGQKQTAYQVLVASTSELLAKDQGDLWDSGKTASEQSIQLEYAGPSTSLRAGKPLESLMICHWKVRVWDKDGKRSAWSKPASWSMGLLKPEDPASPGFAEAGWQAKWVKPAGTETAPWIRKEFTLAAAPERALAFVNVKGYYELYVNGKKVGDDVLAPAVSQDKKRSFYTTGDIVKLLRAGPNCVGLWLGRGWAKDGAVGRVQLEMFVGGQRVVVGTDRTWTSMTSTHALRGPWGWNNMGGESMDARKEIAGWNEVGCKTGAWLPVEEIAAPGGAVTAQSCPPNRINQGLAGIRPDETGPGFKKILIKPAIVGDLTWVKCGYDSSHGRIISNWRLEGDKLKLDITIPANTTATIHVPTTQPDAVTESGRPVAEAKDVKFLRTVKNAAIYEVGSGQYAFTAPFAPRATSP
ncbi:MAG: alpha-L-rhamnosidase N-terminal domain-containing protein [Kiritimatiellaeota bacterium]|nr:alpha-L-rhamnosidase N-terminal domain-containing protein [Kiritimatiellota bacterium]